jgi:hypothetical protein
MLRLILLCTLFLITCNIDLLNDLYAQDQNLNLESPSLSPKDTPNLNDTVELKDRLGTPIPSTVDAKTPASTPTPGPSPTPMKLAQ